MNKQINVLILDDNDIIAKCIVDRILKASDSNSNYTRFDIIPHHLKIDLKDINKASEYISNKIVLENIEYLLLDRGFYNLIDSVEGNHPDLDKKLLYGEWNDPDGIKIEAILGLIPSGKFKNIKGIVVYTYDENNDEPAKIRQVLSEILPKKFDKKTIEVISTYSEVYHLANLQLYNIQRLTGIHSDLISLGSKSDMKLYGLFIGEILYHRVISLIQKRKTEYILTKRQHAIAKIVLLFLMVTSLNLGANALYNLCVGGNNSATNSTILLISMLFALIIPLLILYLKPEIIISVED